MEKVSIQRSGTRLEVRRKLERAIDNGAQEISMILMGPGSGERGGTDQLTRFAETVLQPMRQRTPLPG